MADLNTRLVAYSIEIGSTLAKLDATQGATKISSQIESMCLLLL